MAEQTREERSPGLSWPYLVQEVKRHMNITNEEAETRNLKYWDEIAPVHYKSYDIDTLLEGKSLIDKIQKKDFYPIEGKEILHLQCHIGTDTLSLVMDGAKVTGVDFSEESIKIAKELSQRLDLQADFVCSNIYNAKDKVSKKFDMVYTSKGVLPWLKNIGKWAKVVNHFLKDDGIFYIMDIHPIKYIFDDTIKNKLIVKYPYFHKPEPTMWGNDDYPDYADKSYIPKNYTYEWTWSMSDIINALITNGLIIEQVNEYDKLFYNGHPGMVKDKDGWWYLEEYKGEIPFTFTIKARKA